jgi:hypothetical protein
MSDATQAEDARAAYNDSALAVLDRIARADAPTDLAALIAKFIEIRIIARNAVDAAYTLRFRLNDRQ